MNALPVYNVRYTKAKRRIYTNFCDLNLPEDDVECESFTIVFIDSLLSYENKYYLQVYYLQNGVILMTCVIKDDSKFYKQIF